MARNIDMKVGGKSLVIRVDLSKTSGSSKSGKTLIIASTDGNIPVEGHSGVFVGVNVYKKA